MTTPTPPDAALHAIIRQASHLVLDFDGTICTLYARQTAQQTADQLRTIITSTAEIPGNVRASGDPLAVLAYAATISPEIAERVEAELTRQELSAVTTAQPTGYGHDLITSAREGNRTVTIISTCSADAVRSYLERASLDEQVACVCARVSGGTAPSWDGLISQALTNLNADPDDCALVARSADLLQRAAEAGMPTISYAPVTATGEPAPSDADATVTSLADLVLRLRASPLPN
jgi:beta-phosphoglucomutase-like phosphatase (HAD superfamily)